jgi:hypothetical protein
MMIIIGWVIGLVLALLLGMLSALAGNGLVAWPIGAGAALLVGGCIGAGVMALMRMAE